MASLIQPLNRSLLFILAALTNGLLVTAAEPADVPLHSRIDSILEADAGTTNFAAISDDAEFLRRVSLDLAGKIPDADFARTFIADRTASKRTQIIDDLLASPDWSRRMADLFHVILMERRGDDADWQVWLEKSFATNKPWNLLVFQVLNADADDEENRAAAYFMSKRLEKYGQNPVDYPGLVRDIGRMFLGQDLQCAECHNHLFIDDYKQLDFQGLFAVYKNTFVRRDVKFPAVGEKAMTAPVEFVSVFDPTQRKTGPRIPGGSEFEIPEPKPAESPAPKKKQPEPPRPEWSAVELLARELTRPENRQFARTTVNRVWYVLLGRGLIHPVDLDHSGNPPSQPQLLELLTDEFIAHHYDLKWLIREIVLSKAWQRTSRLAVAVEPPKPDRFAVAIERPLMAEQLLASVIQATESTELLEAAAHSSAKTEANTDPAATTEAATDDESKLPTIAELKTAFAGAFANEAREPEGEFKATVKGALFWRNSDEVQKLLQRRPGNLVDRLMKIEQPSPLIDELYLAVLSRHASPDETAVMTDFLNAAGTNREAVVRDAAWALLTSVEFYVNH
ncbi:MAG: DUF1553 domain-containing protein [Rhodopirellula sp.]|nr:DUF1553 domain-containing protein [Rhodopirellula sp.]